MKFHERFEISVGIEEVRKRFVNRVSNVLFNKLFYELSDSDRYGIRIAIATALGEKHDYNLNIDDYVAEDFYRCLHAIETFYDFFRQKYVYPMTIPDFGREVTSLLAKSEVDLGIKWVGIKWEGGKFIKTGAKLLDDKLVNEPLKWLRDKEYKNVLSPYEKGLNHFLESDKRPELLSDVITDMYEALEALAMIITGKDKDLSGNRELFIKKVEVSGNYKAILKEYISYANDFRHASNRKGQKPDLSSCEVESFIYLTGIFIRLAMGTPLNE